MNKRNLILSVLLLCVSFCFGQIWDFAEPNKNGDIIYYRIFSFAGEEVAQPVNMGFQTEERYYVDTLFLPDSVRHNGVTYFIQYTGVLSGNGVGSEFPLIFGSTKASPKVAYIPSTIKLRPNDDPVYKFQILAIDPSRLDFGYYVDSSHPTLASEDGVLFTKDKDTLVLFPIPRRGTYNVPRNVKYLSAYSFTGTGLDTLNLADDIDIRVSYDFLEQARYMKSFRYPNSITRLEEGVGVRGGVLEEVIFGSGLTYIGGDGYLDGVIKRIYCLAVNPPTCLQGGSFYQNKTLFVPRKSISLYKQANVWKNFPLIEPIEPPVVAGVNEAEISWVTNAEASSYTLTIYLDEAQTKRLVTLSFDDRGYLTKMDFNPDVFKAPHRMPQEVNQLQEEDYPEFNKYLTFTVTGLTAHTKYYFVRQTLNAMSEVIDEETGSFETLPDGAPTGINPLLFEPSPQKTFENGMLRIRKNDNTYNVNGAKID